MAQAKKKTKLLRKQAVMRRVLLATVPCIAGGVYYFGWRVLACILFCCAVGFIAELLFCRWRKEPVSEAVFVTAVLFALIMPAGTGWHVQAVGMVFAVIFSKEVFGGFGRNFFNPALAGRCFVYICFPVALTATWPQAAAGPMGAMDRWTTVESTAAVTGATPMAYLKSGALTLRPADEEGAIGEIPFVISADEQVTVSRGAFFKALILGRISGTAGVTSALLILIGGIYLYYTKTASRETILSVIITYAVLNQLLYWLKIEPVPGAWPAVLGGGFLFGAFFMATDPISSPKTKAGRIIYGILISVCALVIRNFSIFNGGLMFAILIGNMFAPIIDYGVGALAERKKAAVSVREDSS